MAVLLEADLWCLTWGSQFVVHHNNWVTSNFSIFFIQPWCQQASCVLARGESSLFSNAGSPQTDTEWAQGTGAAAPHPARWEAGVWIWPLLHTCKAGTHMETQAHSYKHANIHLVPLLVIPAGTLGKKYLLPLPFICPHSTHPTPTRGSRRPSQRGVPSVAPPPPRPPPISPSNTIPTYSPKLPLPSCAILAVQHLSRPDLGTTKTGGLLLYACMDAPWLRKHLHVLFQKANNYKVIA